MYDISLPVLFVMLHSSSRSSIYAE